MFSGLITAIRTLTSVPVRGPEAKDPTSALPWFPFVGFLLGAVCVIIVSACEAAILHNWPGGIALAVVLAGILLTRALHLDGLADWVDGFWGGRDRESILRIMKDSCTGSFGAAAISFLLMAKWVCVLELIRYGGASWIIIAFVVSRTAMVDLAAANGYARTEGGTGSPFIEGASSRHLGAAIAAAMLLLALSAPSMALAWMSALLVGILMSRLFGLFAQSRIGGITGDLLGACCEIVELAILAMGAGACHWQVISNAVYN